MQPNCWAVLTYEERMKTTHSTHSTVIWRQTCDKGPFRQRLRKPTSASAWITPPPRLEGGGGGERSRISGQLQEDAKGLIYISDRIVHFTAFVPVVYC